MNKIIRAGLLLLSVTLVACEETESSSGGGAVSEERTFQTDTTVEGVNITGTGSTTQIDENTAEGRWNGSFTSETICGNGTINLNIRQSGESLTGSINATSDGCGSASEDFTGTLSGNNLTIIDDDGDRYNLKLNGDMLSGSINDKDIGTVDINLFR